jgi:glyoxylase-like metal-dependent hydrolase (beta-lactamase superfamily II)
MSTREWEQPGAFEVLPGVFRIPLPLPHDGLHAVNVYAIKDAGGLVLIDSGWDLAVTQQQLERSLAEIDQTLGDITHFLITHVHRDHYGQAVTTRRDFGTKIQLGAGERPTLDRLVNPIPGAPPESFGNLVRAGAIELQERMSRPREHIYSENVHSNDIWEFPDEWLAPGSLDLAERSLEVIETPGHTRGHVVFHDAAAAALFAGDHVLPEITPSIGFESVPSLHPLADFMNSLRILRSRPDALLLPAHGPVSPSVHARVDELLDHHEERLTACADIVAAGADTAFEVASALRWTRRLRYFTELDYFNQLLAIGETIAHLDVLETRGWLTCTVTDDHVAHYARA